MTPEQLAYLARRRRQIRYWPWLALVLVLGLAAGYGWLWQHAPININPFLVLEQFNHKTVSDEEMIMLAARGSLALATCGMFLLVIVFLVSAALVNEMRLIRLLDEVVAGGASVAPDPQAAASGEGEGNALPEGAAAAGEGAGPEGQAPVTGPVVDGGPDGAPPSRG